MRDWVVIFGFDLESEMGFEAIKAFHDFPPNGDSLFFSAATAADSAAGNAAGKATATATTAGFGDACISDHQCYLTIDLTWSDDETEQVDGALTMMLTMMTMTAMTTHRGFKDPYFGLGYWPYPR